MGISDDEPEQPSGDRLRLIVMQQPLCSILPNCRGHGGIFTSVGIRAKRCISRGISEELQGLA
jgi:hypothetical protein